MTTLAHEGPELAELDRDHPDVLDLLEAFGSAVRPLEPMTVSECADKYRRLPKNTPEPGRFSTDRIPYMRGIQDSLGDRTVAEVIVMKATRAGISEAVRSGLNYWVRYDPGECLWVFPDENSVKKAFRKHLLPMVRLSLKKYLGGSFNDLTYQNISFRSMDVTAGWAGSPQSLSGDGYRYVVCDETDKYPEFSGKESGPLELAADRSKAYGFRAKRVLLSSPRSGDGAIATAFKNTADKRYFHVPCVDCGELQILTWAQVKWPKRPEGGDRIEHAENVKEDQAARYHCIRCGFEHDDAARLDMVDGGVWLDKDGKEPAKRRRVAFHISALYSPWVTLSGLAEMWIKAQGHLNKMMSFYNLQLGEAFEQRVAAVKANVFEEKAAAGHPRHLVPAWAGMILATADTQKDGFWYKLTAWGRGYRSRVIDHGFAHDEEHLRDLALERRLPIEGCDDASQTMKTRWMFIDVGGGTEVEGRDGNTTHQVYTFALTDPRIIPCKGHGGRRPPARELVVKQHSYKPKKESLKPYQGLLAVIDTQYFKDVLWARINNKDGELYEVHQEIDADFVAQMTAEHKVFERQGSRGVQVWKPISEGRANHLWDTAVYQAALAEHAEVAFLPTPEQLRREREAVIEKRAEVAKKQPYDLTDPHGRPFFATDR